MTPQPPPSYPDLDYTSTEWASIRNELNKILEAEMNSLCLEEDPIKAAKLRGSISTLKRVVGWEKKQAERRHRQAL